MIIGLQSEKSITLLVLNTEFIIAILSAFTTTYFFTKIQNYVKKIQLRSKIVFNCTKADFTITIQGFP